MYNLLIVDDEPIIVDVLHALLQQAKLPELELTTAYATRDAIEQLHRVNADIVLSDIRMPEISGLELQEYAQRIWPRCKFIFLTGYDDFEYLRHAMRIGVVDYILKNEDEQKIIEAVWRAMERIERERSEEQLLYNARQQYAAAIPKLREEYLSDLICNADGLPQARQERFNELSIALDGNRPVCLLAGRVMEWPDRYRPSDRSLLNYAIRNVVEETVKGFAHTVSIVYERHLLLWFIQPLADDGGDETVIVPRMPSLVIAALDSIQSVCRKLFGLTLSLAFDRCAANWKSISHSFDLVHFALNGAMSSGGSIAIVDSGEQPQENARRMSDCLLPTKLLELETMLESGQQRAFMECVEEFSHSWEAPAGGPFMLQSYYAFVALILGYLQRYRLQEALEHDIAISRFFSEATIMSVAERRQALRKMAELLFREQRRVRDSETNVIIRKAHEYVDRHLDGDVSLSAVAHEVYLSPSYFSRLYKQETGMNFSDYINRKKLLTAKAMLVEPHRKIHEIAHSLGFESAAYFSYFFKKHAGITPQDFRNMKSEHDDNKSKEM